MSKKKTNPRRVPVSQADLRKAKDIAMEEAVKYAWAIMLTVMRDKEGWGRKRLDRLWQEVNELSDSVAQGYVKISDLLWVLKDEADIVIK